MNPTVSNAPYENRALYRRDEILATPKILLVDDDETTRETLSVILENSGFQVVVAANVNDALSLIGSQTFDVLLSDLHMPGPGDGLTVVSAMPHANPKAVTLILSSYPAMKEAAEATLLQADDVLVKPMAVVMLVDLIRGRLKQRTIPARVIAGVADILEVETQATISDWLLRVELEPDIITIPWVMKTVRHTSQTYSVTLFAVFATHYHWVPVPWCQPQQLGMG